MKKKLKNDKKKEEKMGEITKIEPQKKRKGRFNIYIDDEFACGLSEDTIIDEGIAEGQKLQDIDIEKLIEKDQGAKAYDKSLKFLSFRVRSEKEIKDKLIEKEFHPKIIEKTILKLKKVGQINDKEFALTWIKDRCAVKPSGKYLITRELKQKGVSQEIIDKVLKKMLPEDKEFKQAIKLAQKKEKVYKSLPRLEFNKKISAVLARRGFSWEMIKKTIDKIKEKD